MGYTTPSISANEQNIIMSNAKMAVYFFADAYCAKLGFKNFFTKEDLEDIIGNTMYKACRSFNTFNPEKGQLSTWVSNIAHNCVRNAFHYKYNRMPISCELFVEDNETGDEFEVDEYCDVRRGPNNETSELRSEYEADRAINFKEFEACVRAECRKLNETNQRFERMVEDHIKPKKMAELEGCTANAAAKRVWGIRHTLKAPLNAIAKEFDIPMKAA